jgi:hypothetical protein
MVVGMAQPLSGPGVFVVEQHQHDWREVGGKYMFCVYTGRDKQRCGAFAYQGSECAWGTRMYRAISTDGSVLVERPLGEWVAAWEQSQASGMPVVIFERIGVH